MVFRQRYLAGMLWRFGLLLLAGIALATTIRLPGYAATATVSALLCVAALAALWRHVQRSNVELARFIEATRHGDLSQGFSATAGAGSGFAEVGAALGGAVERLRAERDRLTEANRFYEAVLDDAPIALLTIDGEGRVDRANKAARRLFPESGGIRVEDFARYGASFARRLQGDPAAGPRLVSLTIDDMPHMAMVSVAAVHRLGGLVHAVAVQPIQSELNAAELAAQGDLIRVLTHEIMNSMTPVTSLAHSAAALLAEADAGSKGLAEARAAVETLARRADGLMQFVESYKRISRTPELHRRRFALAGWAVELEALFRAGDVAEGIAFSCTVDPPDITIDADPALLSQALINLLRNAAQAAATAPHPTVSLSFTAARGGSVRIDVADNGPGIAADLATDIFLPFFTTRRDGTGVGLSVVRQLVHAHGGTIAVENRPKGGALFRIRI